MAENKENVNGPKMSLEEEGAGQISKVFFNAEGLIIVGLSEGLCWREHTLSIRRLCIG